MRVSKNQGCQEKLRLGMTKIKVTKKKLSIDITKSSLSRKKKKNRR